MICRCSIIMTAMKFFWCWEESVICFMITYASPWNGGTWLFSGHLTSIMHRAGMLNIMSGLYWTSVRQIRTALTYINQHYRENPGLEEIAGRAMWTNIICAIPLRRLPGLPCWNIWIMCGCQRPTVCWWIPDTAWRKLRGKQAFLHLWICPVFLKRHMAWLPHSSEKGRNQCAER